MTTAQRQASTASRLDASAAARLRLHRRRKARNAIALSLSLAAMAFGIFDEKQRTLLLANSGFPWPVLYQRGEGMVRRDVRRLDGLMDRFQCHGGTLQPKTAGMGTKHWRAPFRC